jgi:hypothetical protein
MDPCGEKPAAFWPFGASADSLVRCGVPPMTRRGTVIGRVSRWEAGCTNQKRDLAIVVRRTQHAPMGCAASETRLGASFFLFHSAVETQHETPLRSAELCGSLLPFFFFCAVLH